MKAYSNTWDNIYLFKKSRYSKNVTVIIVMDEKVLVHHKKINILWTEKYFEFLEWTALESWIKWDQRFIRWACCTQNGCLITIILVELGWVGLLNKAFSLKQNPIETYFSLIKKHFRQVLLENYKNSVNS
jgi:hypothetical protein